MQRFAAVASVAFLPFLALAAPAHAQAGDCPSTAGAAASLEQFPSGLFEIYTAVNSASISRSFMLKDSQGHGLRDVDLEVVLPDYPAELAFQTGFGWTLPSPKRVMMKTLGNCEAGIPNIVGGPEAGSFAATVRAVGSETPFTIPIHVVDTQGYVRREYPASGTIVWPVDSDLGRSAPYASADWSDGAGHFGPLAGVAMTFTAPSTGPTLAFANGAQQITLSTGATGVVSASARTVGGPGSFMVRATFPDGTLATSFRYVALGAPEVQLGPAFSIEYGARTGMQATARYVGVPCDLDFLTFAGALITVTSNGVGLRNSGLSLQGTRPCPSDVLEAPFNYWVAGVPFGTWEVAAEVTGRNGVVPTGRSTVAVNVLPAKVTAAATGRGSIRVGASDPGYSLATGKCSVNSARAVDPNASDFPASRPEAASLPYGAIRFELGDCYWVSTSDFGVRPPPPPVAQRVLMQVDEDLDPGTVAWAYGPTRDNPLPHWYELRTTVTGRFAQFDVTDAGIGDDSLSIDQVIRPLIALAVPKLANVDGRFQDLWWAGPQENGWGMSITQHRDVLFAALFVYDLQGNPRWLVMSGGEWNEARTSYSGNVYRPKGSPLAQSIAASFNVGAPVGTLRLTPLTYDTMRLEYTIDGVSGSKEVRRQSFGPAHPYPVPRFDDLWWGGLAENGWGFALAQQYRTFFGVLFTYDANGDPIWFVAPAGALTDNAVESKVYRTRGSPWLGTTYDPARLQVTEVGSLKLSLQDGWETAALSGTIAGWRALSYLVSRQPF